MRSITREWTGMSARSDTTADDLSGRIDETRLAAIRETVAEIRRKPFQRHWQLVADDLEFLLAALQGKQP